MKKQTVYWLPKLGAMAIASMAFMAASGVIRIIWAAAAEHPDRLTFWFQVILPLLANLIFPIIVLRDGKDRFYRTAIPVWLGCVFFAEKALGFSSQLHTILCLLLYALVAVLYTATVTGKVSTQKPLWLLFGLPMLYHIFVEDLEKLNWPLHECLPELSVLCCMAALLCLSLAMRKRELAEGEIPKRFGDRNDGRRLRTLSPMFAVPIYLMKTRVTSQNLVTIPFEITKVEQYILEKRKAGLKHFGFLHVLLAAYARTCARYPGLNRFVAGQRIFSRDEEIEVNMTIKKEMTTDAPDSVIKVCFGPGSGPDEIYARFEEKVREVKDSPADTSFDKLVGIFNLIPGLVMVLVAGILQLMDYFGLIPRFLTRLSPFHGSLYLTSMASLGIPPIYHHLYDFGNVPVFCSFGKKRREYELQRDGSVVAKKYIDCKFSMDERIADGYYYAAAIRYLNGLMSNPWQMDTPVEEIKQDQL